MRREPAIGGLRYASALVTTNLKASLALRGAFWLQASFMLLNNVTFFVTWLIFFHRFNEVRGWRLDDMLVLFAVVAGGYGLFNVLAGGALQLARAIGDGDLDPILVQPRPPLLQIVASRSTASGWGDLATGVIFLSLATRSHLAAAPLGLAAIVASAVVFTASAVLLQSLAFWLGRIEVVARQMLEFQITFGLYPSSLFGGALRVVLYTAIPAGFVGYLPAEFVRTASLPALAALFAGTAFFVALALVVFHRGLRVYESGSRFGGVW